VTQRPIPWHVAESYHSLEVGQYLERIPEDNTHRCRITLPTDHFKIFVQPNSTGTIFDQLGYIDNSRLWEKLRVSCRLIQNRYDYVIGLAYFWVLFFLSLCYNIEKWQNCTQQRAGVLISTGFFNENSHTYGSYSFYCYRHCTEKG